MADGSDGDSVYKTVYLIDFFRFFCDQVVDSDPKWRKDRSTVVNRARFVGLKRSMTEISFDLDAYLWNLMHFKHNFSIFSISNVVKQQ